MYRQLQRKGDQKVVDIHCIAQNLRTMVLGNVIGEGGRGGACDNTNAFRILLLVSCNLIGQ